MFKRNESAGNGGSGDGKMPPKRGIVPGPGEMRSGGKAPLIWFFIMLAMIGLFIFKSPDGGRRSEWMESEFRARLRAGEIVSMTVTPDGEQMLSISGEYRISGDEASGAPARSGNFETKVIRSEALMAELDQYSGATRVETPSPYWGLLVSLLPVILVMVIIYFLISRQMHMAGKTASQFGRSRARMIAPGDLKVKFDDVAGADEAKEEVREIVEYLKDPLKFKLLGGKIPKGCLLTGPPGTGKTLLAKAVACEAGVPFFSISGSDFVEMFVGVGASRVRDMFELARKNSPCLIFIDEIDAVGRSRFSGMGGGHDEREQTLNAMLVEMDGLESRSDVIVLAATNRPDVLDPALLRPGRFDRQVVLDLPDIAGRRKILDVHVKNIKVGDDIDLDVIARTTPGFSGADLASLCNEAALLAAREEREAVVQSDMEEARDKVSWGRERKSRKISDRERNLTAYHEAGHTIVALNCELAVPVHKVTIIPRGRAYLGATFMMPREDAYTQTRQELLDAMAVAMGGRVAEEIFIGDISSGASGDIEQATRTARMMVCAYGMDDELGPVQYGDHLHPMHLRADLMPHDDYSQETAREIDNEIKNLVKGALGRAREILNRERANVEKLAKALLERETLTIAEINQLLGREASGAEAGPGVAFGPEAVSSQDCEDERQ